MTKIKDTIGTMSLTAVQMPAGPAPASADEAVAGPAATPMAASPMAAPPSPAVLPPSGISAPTLEVSQPAAPTLVDKCATLKELVDQAAEKIGDIKSWAKKDGIKDTRGKSGEVQLEQELDADSAEAKDPDLAFSVKGVIYTGEKLKTLLKNPDFCNRGKPAAIVDQEA